MASVTDPWASLVETYFPADQQASALCILAAELARGAASCPNVAPASCVSPLPGLVSCYPDQTPRPATAYGLFQIVDVCWSPDYAGADTPFTADEWSLVLDPNVNVWMASVVWSLAGWRAWTSCPDCPGCPPCVSAVPPCELPCPPDICSVTGGPIPYPRGPLPVPVSGSPSPLLPLLLVTGALGGLAYAEHRRWL